MRQYTEDDLHYDLDDTLGCFGLSVSIFRDDSGVAEASTEPALVLTKDAAKPFVWDMDEPFRKLDGFQGASLFIYLNDDAALRCFIENGCRSRENEVCWKPDCGEAEKAVELLKKAENNPKYADACLEELFDMIPCGDGEAEDFSSWLEDMCAPTSRWDFDQHYLESPMSNGLFLLGAQELESLYKTQSTENIKKARENLERFVDAYKKSLGGAMHLVSIIRERFKKTFGAGQAAGVSAVDETFPSDPENADTVFVIHASAGLDTPQKAAETIAAEVLEVRRGNVFGFNFLRGEESAFADGSGTAYGYIGTDLEKNGMKNDIFDIVEKLENRKKPSVKRHMRM